MAQEDGPTDASPGAKRDALKQKWGLTDEDLARMDDIDVAKFIDALSNRLGLNILPVDTRRPLTVQDADGNE